MAVVISSAMVASETTAIPLTHARIGYHKVSGTISASTEASGFLASSADNELTYSHWKPSALPAWWEITLDTAEEVNYFGIAAHTLGTNSTAIKAQYHDGTSWVDIDETLPADDSTIMFIFDNVFSSRFRVYLTGSAVPKIGVIYIGKLLEMQRAIYGGHSPINLSRITVTRPNSSERGQWLGRSIVRSGLTGDFSWSNLTAEWYREYFDPFVEHARTKPFFIAWRPATFPKEVAYVWTSRDITPSNSGRRNLMDVSFSAGGLG